MRNNTRSTTSTAQKRGENPKTGPPRRVPRHRERPLDVSDTARPPCAAPVGSPPVSSYPSRSSDSSRCEGVTAPDGVRGEYGCEVGPAAAESWTVGETSGGISGDSERPASVTLIAGTPAAPVARVSRALLARWSRKRRRRKTMRRKERTRSLSTRKETTCCLRCRSASSSILGVGEGGGGRKGRVSPEHVVAWEGKKDDALEGAVVRDEAVVREQDEHSGERDALERLFGVVDRLVVDVNEITAASGDLVLVHCTDEVAQLVEIDALQREGVAVAEEVVERG